MALFRRNFKEESLKPAEASWIPHENEKSALVKRKHVSELGRVDQIWPWLEQNYPNILAVNAPHAFHPETYNYLDLSENISKASAAFVSFGIKAGDVVALFAENSPRWLIADQAIMRIDAADAVRGALAPIDELRYIINDCKATALVVQTGDLFKRLSLSEEEINRLKVVVQLEDKPIEGVLGWEEFVSKGNEVLIAAPRAQRGFDSAHHVTATILYTSGTTGQPKGVPLSHANLLHQMRSLACVANPNPGSAVLSVLPIWHSYERSAEYYFFSCACSQHYTTIKQLKHDLLKVRPIVMATVPRLWEAIKSGFDDALRSMSQRRQNLLRLALRNSSAFKSSLRSFRGIWIEELSLSLRLKALIEMAFRWPFHAIASSLLWPKVREKLSGGKLMFPINGGGAIAPEVDSFFEALGIELLVGYGLTETSPVVSCRRPWSNIRGSSGPPLPETEFRIVEPETFTLKNECEQGLVLVRGPQVMNGYLGNPLASSKVLDKDGWFNTGDLGILLPDGSLVLTGRAKDTIVLSNGENIEPGPLEEFLLGSSLFEQVMLVGQDEKQLGLLVVPQEEAMKIWIQNLFLPFKENSREIFDDEQFRRLLKSEINDLLSKRKGSRPDERVLGVALVEPFTIENGLLTQTLKQRRDRITKKYERSIALIYGR